MTLTHAHTNECCVNNNMTVWKFLAAKGGQLPTHETMRSTYVFDNACACAFTNPNLVSSGMTQERARAGEWHGRKGRKIASSWGEWNRVANACGVLMLRSKFAIHTLAPGMNKNASNNPVVCVSVWKESSTCVTGVIWLNRPEKICAMLLVTKSLNLKWNNKTGEFTWPAMEGTMNYSVFGNLTKTCEFTWQRQYLA